MIDFRKLNEKTVGDAYPLPNISDILDQLGKARYFSCFDLASGFHQIPMELRDALKTAFNTSNDHFENKHMPFGLKRSRDIPTSNGQCFERITGKCLFWLFR